MQQMLDHHKQSTVSQLKNITHDHVIIMNIVQFRSMVHVFALKFDRVQSNRKKKIWSWKKAAIHRMIKTFFYMPYDTCGTPGMKSSTISTDASINAK